MLKQLSRMKRTQSAIIIGFAIFMGVSLVLFYAPSRGGTNAAPTRSTERLARVGADEITVGDFNSNKEAFKQQYAQFGGQISLAQLGLTDPNILKNLVNEHVVAQEAARVGLGASDAEVSAKIKQLFSEGGKFVGVERYRESVTARGTTIESFEESVRRSIAADKLRAFVTAGVTVSDDELLDEYKRQNTSFDLLYVPVTADKLAARLNPSEEDLQNYYNAHRDEFRINDTQKKISYLYVDQQKAGAKLNLSDEELRAEYDQLSDENKQAGIRVQQIVLKIARPDLEDTVRAKADELIAQARGEGGADATVSEEKFAELARGNSEDPVTAKNGGQLPGLVRRNPNNPTDPLQSTLTMTPGQVSEPVKFKNAYYIFRRGDAVPKSFEDAKQELTVSLRNRRAYATAAQLAKRAAERLKEVKDVRKVAEELAGEANMTPAEMVRETGFIQPGDDVPQIGSSQQFEEAIAPFANVGDTGEQVGIKGGFAVPLLVEKRDPRIPEFAEVRDKVLDAARNEQARTRLEQSARELAESARNPEELRTRAAALGFEAQTAMDFKLGKPLGDAGTSAAADAAIFNLMEGGVTRPPIKVGDKWIVVGATKREEADLAEFNKQRDTLRETELDAQRAQVFADYINAARARMERDGKIKIDDDVLARITAESDEEAAPPIFNRPPRGGSGAPQPPR